jgi:thiol-disulfide isomerase/thioredoxin
MKTRMLCTLCLVAALFAAACTAGNGTANTGAANTGAVQSEPSRTEPAVASPDDSVLVGTVTREQVEAAVPDWVQAETASQPDREAAGALAAVEPGADVTIFLGTWCGDSRRELSRLWRALDEAGGSVPFDIHYIAVDHLKEQPADRIAASGIRFVPTLIVSRGGREVGRIVEESPNGVEVDLLALLTGKASGVVTGSARAAASSPSTSR